MDNFSNNCHNCAHKMEIKVMKCPNCDLEISGNIELPRLAQLDPQSRKFIELFVLSGGSLKEVGKILDLSYPTVRNRLDSIIESLKQLNEEKKVKREEIIKQLEAGVISSSEALQLLNKLN
ncbi:DUF2089 family protein [Lentisphaerota bacterium WC36G]|nr:DUF2089 domain-containing protein [Lentisphaerae bacterium WC36]